MSRSVKEWKGKTDDSPVPDRVRLRVLKKFNECCAKCERKIASGVKWICDHIVALINGGENREQNLQPLCTWCEPDKTAADVAVKSKTYDLRRKSFLPREAKSRPMPGSRASGIRKRMNGKVEKWA